MLKFFYVAWISNFHKFLANFSPDLKHIILSLLDELLSLPCMVVKLDIYSFHPNLNQSKISHVVPDMSQTIHGGLVWQIWQDSSSNFDPLKQYVFKLYLTWKCTTI